MSNDLPQRKPLRKEGFDYDFCGVYFITICTQDRREILSQIVGVDVPDDPYDYQQIKLTDYGTIADKYVKQLNDFYNHLSIEWYVIMPNHIHILLNVLDGTSRTSSPTKQHSTVSQFVSTFKRFCNKEYGGNIWQRGYNDHIIRDREDYEKHVRYIVENPMNWYFDELYNP